MTTHFNQLITKIWSLSMSFQYSNVKKILNYLNSPNRNQCSKKFLDFLLNFNECSILITLKRYSYLNQLHRDIILVSDLRQYIIEGNTNSDLICSANLSSQEEIEEYFEEISRYQNVT